MQLLCSWTESFLRWFLPDVDCCFFNLNISNWFCFGSLTKHYVDDRDNCRTIPRRSGYLQAKLLICDKEQY